jgi:hypothetical protein
LKDFRELQVWSKAHEVTLTVVGFLDGQNYDRLSQLTIEVRRMLTALIKRVNPQC